MLPERRASALRFASMRSAAVTKAAEKWPPSASAADVSSSWDAAWGMCAETSRPRFFSDRSSSSSAAAATRICSPMYAKRPSACFCCRPRRAAMASWRRAARALVCSTSLRCDASNQGASPCSTPPSSSSDASSSTTCVAPFFALPFLFAFFWALASCSAWSFSCSSASAFSRASSS